MAVDNRWVVLIYMAATSPQLRELMERELLEMSSRLRLLTPDDLRVYALMDTPDGNYAVRHALHRPATLNPSAVPQLPPREPTEVIVPLDRKLEEILGKKGSFLAKLVEWRFTADPTYESDLTTFGRTLLILWGHSQGVAAALSQPGSPAYALVGNGGFGFNDLSGESLSLPEIRRAIAEGQSKHPRQIDILSFDSCFMSAAEVSAEFQPHPPDPPPDAEPNEPDEEPLDNTPVARGQGATTAQKQHNTDRKARNAARLERLKLKARRREERLIRQAEADKPAQVEYVIASQSAVLLDGLDYGRVFDAFIDTDDLGKLKFTVEPQVLGARLLEQACSGGRSPISLSLLHTKDDKAYKGFKDAFGKLVTQLGELLDTGTDLPTPSTPPERPRFPHPSAATAEGANRSEWLRIRDAFQGATWHRVRQFIDVADLCRRLANNSREKGLRDAATGVLRTLAENALVIDVRSAHPLVFSGLSVYCPWLFPTPDEVRKGAWNAVVDLFDYSRELWFNRGAQSWGALVYHAKHVLEESRQRAINTELADLREASRQCDEYREGRRLCTSATAHGSSEKSMFLDGGGGPKPGGGDGFNIAEPDARGGTNTERSQSRATFGLKRARAYADFAAASSGTDKMSIGVERPRD
jgi:hypothetical protein